MLLVKVATVLKRGIRLLFFSFFPYYPDNQKPSPWRCLHSMTESSVGFLRKERKRAVGKIFFPWELSVISHKQLYSINYLLYSRLSVVYVFYNWQGTKIQNFLLHNFDTTFEGQVRRNTSKNKSEDKVKTLLLTQRQWTEKLFPEKSHNQIT